MFTVAQLFHVRVTKKLNPWAEVVKSDALWSIVGKQWRN